MKRLRAISIAVVITGVCGAFGVWGVLQRINWSEPPTVQCDARAVKDLEWVRVTSCEFSPASVRHEGNDTWLTVEHVNGANAEPMTLHSRRPNFVAFANEVPVVLEPFLAKVEVTSTGVILEETTLEPMPPSLIWPIVSLVAALFWLVVTTGSLLPKKEPHPNHG